MGVKPFFFYFSNYFSSKVHLYTSPRYYVGGRTAAKGQWSAAVRQYTIRISLNNTSQKGRCPGCIGHVSGCHINPAVTAGLITGAKIGLIKGLLYMVAQSVGAILGAGILRVLVPVDSGVRGKV